jgi:capsular polysaccharide export protein
LELKRTEILGIKPWKRWQIDCFLGEGHGELHYADSSAEALRRQARHGGAIAVWAAREEPGLAAAAAAQGAPLIRIEDGFLRSVGLGSNHVGGASLVVDEQGIYFDPRSPSRLEQLLQSAQFDAALMQRAARLREFLVQHGLSKYNVGVHDAPDVGGAGRRRLLVPGQVEDDASVRFGSPQVRGNLELLRLVREAEPRAWIVYKPHPDIEAGTRPGHIDDAQALRYADRVVREASAAALFLQVDAVHTMTSLLGFEALLRGLPVVCWGQPFYAGWGLTQDRAPHPRRTRRLELDALVAAALILYPRYADLEARRACEVEDIAARLAARPPAPIQSERGALRRTAQLCLGLYRSWVSTHGRPEVVAVRVLFDATRLIARRLAAPTGIDRVDLAYAQALAAAPGFDLRLLAFDLLGPRLLDEASAARLIGETARRWRAGAGTTGADYARLRDWLLAPAGTPRPAFKRGAGAEAPAPALLRRPGDGLRLRRALREGPPAIYLNTSHGRLFRRRVPRWLARERLGGVFFVHDLIPLEFPEFNRPREPQRHLARLDTVGAHAREVLVNSAATRDALERHYQARRAPVPRICVAPLGVEGRFADPGGVEPPRPQIPYFVVLGTIEPRKNHQLLLQLWRRWIAEAGAAAPRLVVIGRRGWENQVVFNTLDRAEALAGHVVECGGLNDAEVGALLRGAAALLSPSFAEGYGLPVAEALAAGTPVLASAIAAHREVGGDCAEYLDPLDGGAWLQALRDYAAPASPRRTAQLVRLRDWHRPRWDEHFPPVLDRLRAAALVS